MSEAKPRRIGREVARNDGTVGEGVPPEIEPVTIAPVGPEAAEAEEREPRAVAAAPPTMTPVQSPLEPASQAIGESVKTPNLSADDGWAALAEMQAALATGCEELALEITAIARSDIAAATDAATAMLGARSFAEAVEIGAGMIRRRADAMIEGSAKLSEIGVQAAAAASRPILTRLATGWNTAGHR